MAMRWLWLLVINWLCLCGVAQGQPLTRTFIYPFESLNSYTRMWILGASYYGHEGIDYACPEGTPVYASVSGTVIEATDNQRTKNCINFGNTIVIQKGEYTVRYAHLLFNSVPFEVGQQVRAGQLVGRTSNTGKTFPANSTVCTIGSGGGYHLHYEVRRNNGPHGLNPYRENGEDLFIIDPDGSFRFPTEHDPYQYSPFLNPYVCDNQPSADANWWYSCNRRTDFNLGQSVYGLMRLDNTYVPHTYKVRVYKNGVYQWQQISARYQGMDPQWGWRYSFFAPIIALPVVGDWELRFYVDIGNGFQQDDAPMAVTRFRVNGNNNGQLAGVPASPPPPQPAPAPAPAPAPQPPAQGFVFNSDNNTNPTICDNEPTSPGAPNWIYSCNRRTIFNRGERVYAMFRIDEVFRDPQFKLEGYRNGNREYSWTGNTIAVDHVSGWRHVYTWPQVNNLQAGRWELRYFVNNGNGFPAIPTATTQIDVIDVIAPTFTYDGNKTTCTGPVTGGAGTNWVYTCQNPRQTFNSGQTVYAMIRLDRILADFSTHVDIYRNNQLQWGYDTPVNDVDEQWGWEKTFQWATIPNVTPGDWEVRIFVRPPNSPTATASLLFHVNP